MSEISCGACQELRENAPDFVQNGVTEVVAASLKNDTGFNPALTVLHDNCTDLNNAVDCLIGRMGEELKAYDTCDWKKFMSQFIPNLYEMLKADIMSGCGLWTLTHRLCDSVDNILGLSAHPSKSHEGTWTPEAYAALTTAYDKSLYVPLLVAYIVPGAGCKDEVALGYDGWNIGFNGNIGSRSPGWSMSGLQVGTILAYWRKSQVVPEYMTEERWNSLMFGWNEYTWCRTNHQLGTRFRGYIRAWDGVEHNEDLKARFGEDVLTVCVSTAIGPVANSYSAGGQVVRETKQYVVSYQKPIS